MVTITTNKSIGESTTIGGSLFETRLTYTNGESFNYVSGGNTVQIISNYFGSGFELDVPNGERGHIISGTVDSYVLTYTQRASMHNSILVRNERIEISNIDKTISELAVMPMFELLSGDDEIILSDADSLTSRVIEISTGTGNDAVYDQLVAGSSALVQLNVGSGNDTINLGYGTRNFNITLGSGADTINQYLQDEADEAVGLRTVADFDPSQDKINLIDGEGASFASTYRLVTVQGGVMAQTVGDSITNVMLLAGVNLGQVELVGGVIQASSQSEGVIIGTSGDDILHGTTNDDVIDSLDGNDKVYDGSGNDEVYLGNGNDYVRVGGGQDHYDGGAGKDYISYYDSAGGITIDLAANTVTGSWANNDTINGFESVSGSKTGADKVYGTSGSNTIKTYGGNDKVYDRGGADNVYLGDGNDYVRVGGGEDHYDGGAGKDYISYYDSTGGITIDLAANTVTGSWANNDTIKDFESVSGSKNGADKVYGTSGSNTIKTYGGNDKVYDRGGADDVYLGDGNDYVRVGGGEDHYDGGAGKDYISYYDSTGGITIDLAANTVTGSWANNDTIKDFESASGSKTGADTIYGTNGSNTLKGYGGADELFGRGGDDNIDGGTGDDYLNGGSGDDDINGREGNDVIEGEAGNDSLLGWYGNDVLFGGDGNDLVDGGAGNDFVEGNEGNDTLLGRGGDDVLDGGAGDDFFVAGVGDDGIFMGEGADVLLMTKTFSAGGVQYGNGHDTIFDFEVGVDKILFEEGGMTLTDVLDGLIETESGVKIEYPWTEGGVTTTQSLLLEGVNSDDLDVYSDFEFG